MHGSGMKMLRGLFACGLALLLAPASAFADVGCPQAVTVTQALAAPQSGWTAGLDKLPAEAAGVSVFDGPQTFAGGAPVVRSVKCGPGGS